MANINDYLIWRGDLKIDNEHPFNEIDSMILARFSYLIFDRIQLKNNMKIEEISNQMSPIPNEDFNYNGDKQLISNLGKSERFKDMIVTNFVQNADTESEKQFSAITIHISYSEMYISYEGTDKTINGWKEDFNLSFMKNVPAQLEGLEYLKSVASEYSYKNIRIGGHSKGGNVAIYSAVSAPEDIQNRIISVDNYDGPGFDENLVSEYKNRNIVNKITTYIPQDSIIGRILYHAEKQLVVYSVEKGIYQHDIYSWQIIRNRPVVLDSTSNVSDKINKTVQEWLKNTTADQRKIFVDEIFDVLYMNSVTTTVDFKNTILRKVPQLIKAYREVSDEDRKTISEMVKLFVKTYISTIN